MRLVFPDPVSFELSHPVNERARVRSVSDGIAADPQAWASAKVARIDESFTGAHGRPPVLPREPTRPGNVSMHQHLTAMRGRLDTDPQGEAAVEIGRLDARIGRLSEDLVPELVY